MLPLCRLLPFGDAARHPQISPNASFFPQYLQNAAGQPFPVKVVEKDETTITFDANHEMAGKELNFTIELVSVEE